MAQGRNRQELKLLKAAYELGEKLFDGQYRGQGVPVICHLVRTAGILLSEKEPMDTIIAGLLHAAYMMGQFPDGQCGGMSKPHRRYLKSVIGKNAEELIAVYQQMPVHSSRLMDEHLNGVETYSVLKRQALKIRVANELEDYLDYAMVYRGAAPFESYIEEWGWKMVELGRKLGIKETAGALDFNFKAHLNHGIPTYIRRDYKGVYEHPERLWQKLSTKERVKKGALKILDNLFKGKKQHEKN